MMIAVPSPQSSLALVVGRPVVLDHFGQERGLHPVFCSDGPDFKTFWEIWKSLLSSNLNPAKDEHRRVS